MYTKQNPNRKSLVSRLFVVLFHFYFLTLFLCLPNYFISQTRYHMHHTSNEMANMRLDTSLLKLPETFSNHLETLAHSTPGFPGFLPFPSLDGHISYALHRTGQTTVPFSPQFLLFCITSFFSMALAINWNTVVHFLKKSSSLVSLQKSLLCLLV